jgi:ferredoxin
MPDGDAAPTIVVDRELCMGSGMCIVYAPNTFAHDAETKAVVVDPAGDPIEAIHNAVQACPTSAIRLVTDEHDEDEGDEAEPLQEAGRSSGIDHREGA